MVHSFFPLLSAPKLASSSDDSEGLALTKKNKAPNSPAVLMAEADVSNGECTWWPLSVIVHHGVLWAGKGGG